MSVAIDLTGRFALVTGATRGIGAATATLLRQAGATVFINGRDKAELDRLCQQTEQDSGKPFIPLCFDVSNPEQVKKAFQQLIKHSKQLDILVNNAGVLDDALIGMVSTAQVENTFKTNAFSVIYTCQYAARLMQRNKSGSIINLASIIGRVGNRGQAVYGGSKAAVIGITQSLAKELAPQNIRVNTVAPGFIDTDMTRQLAESDYKQREQAIAMQRVGKAQDVANTVLFLASDLSDYMTGQTLGVDGGMLV